YIRGIESKLDQIPTDYPESAAFVAQIRSLVEAFDLDQYMKTLNALYRHDEIAQGRLGPGRIHHCMRLIGLAERTLERLCRRAASRVAFGKPVSEQTVTQERIAESRIMIEQARLLTLNAAHAMDTVGNKVAKTEIAMIKVAVPNMACQVIDWAIQAHGGGGTSNDFGLTAAYATARLLRLADGPDEVHRNQIARQELKKHSNK
ncbi:acyl-CoA dehydrogenase family protein, partial [Rhodopseudomonas sp. B29]|uniref:acyl-CoA dehydrogenase family protein n=1 Tax=Rhodopseudomonas sp. B29 TaxID=95607 RepID=UPI0003B5FC29